LVALFALWGWSVLQADEVADYLERLGMQELLAVHLEEQLETMASVDREPVVLQLAHLYAEMLAKVGECGSAGADRGEESGFIAGSTG